MLDLKFVVENIDDVVKRLSNRNGDFTYLYNLAKLQDERKQVIMDVESKKALRNEQSKKIGELKRQKLDASHILDEVAHLGDDIKNLDNRLNQIEEENIESFNQKKTDLFITQHPAFRYLAADYDLEMISVSDDGHASEVSAKQLENIIQIIEENQIKTVFYENPLEKDIAQTLADETGVQIALLSAMESIDENSQKDIIHLISDNISNLAESLQ